jgi:hypothetical protein
MALVLFPILLVIAFVLRVQVIGSIPQFFGPGDPAIYFGMARGVLHHGIARVDFIHHYLTRPASISHVEDYYEPVFAYLPALTMCFGGESPAAAAWSSLILGVVAVLLVWWIGRRHGPWVGLLAASIVALEPWCVYYSGVLMKEAAVSVVALLYLWYLRERVVSESDHTKAGIQLGLATIGAGLMQYEMIPILGLTAGVVLALHRPRSLIPYGVACALGLVALASVTWLVSGVLISAKYLYVLGRTPGDPDQLVTGLAAWAKQRTLLPFPYLGQSLLLLWYPPLLLASIVGLLSPQFRGPERTTMLSFLAAYLYLHAIPRDLWARDYIVLTCVLATPAALAMLRPSEWIARPWRSWAAWTLLSFLWLGPWIARLLPARIAPGHPWGLWPRLGLGLACALPVGFLAIVACRSRASRVFAWLTSGAFILTLVVEFATPLSYSRVYANAQFPRFEIERARRERVSRWMAQQVPKGPVLAQHPEEVEAYSGFPAVVMPEVFRPGAVERVAARYGLRYLLVEPGSMPDSMLRKLPVRAIGEKEGCHLLAFRF